MKHKFSSMGRVAIALVLALSLSLVMAVPVSASVISDVTVAVDPATASETGTYTIEFNTNFDLLTGDSDTISVTFPDDTTVPTTYSTGDITVEGTDVATASGNASTRVVDITVPANISAAVDNPVTVVFTTDAVIVNPSTADDYTLSVKTSKETTYVTSGTYTITPVIDVTAPNTVAVTSPNGTEKWAGGSAHNITWTGGDDAVDTATTKGTAKPKA